MSEGRKDDLGKTDFTLVPPKALEQVARVLMMGAKKYDRDNWVRVPDGRRRYTAALMRHAWAAISGEERDPESGESHWAHVACCALFLLSPLSDDSQ